MSTVESNITVYWRKVNVFLFDYGAPCATAGEIKSSIVKKGVDPYMANPRVAALNIAKNRLLNGKTET